MAVVGCQADTYTQHELSDELWGTSLEDTFLALQFYRNYHRNLTLFHEHQRYHDQCEHHTPSTPCRHPAPAQSPMTPLRLPTHDQAAAFSSETVLHADPYFLHNTWSYLDPLDVLPLIATSLQFYDEDADGDHQVTKQLP